MPPSMLRSMLRSIVQLALLVPFCVAASHTQDVAKPPWCMNQKTKIFRIKNDLQLEYGDCELEDQTDDITGVVTYQGNSKLQPDHPCFLDYAHLACEKYPATPMFDPDSGKDICVLINNDGSTWPVEIKLEHGSYDSLVVFAELKGGVSCTEPSPGIWLFTAKNTNAIDFNKTIAEFSAGSERILFVAEGNHFEKVRTQLAQMHLASMFAHVIEHIENRPHAVYEKLFDFLASVPADPVKTVIWVLQPETVPNPKMLQRVAALLKQDMEPSATTLEIVKEWFNYPCKLGDYESEDMCQTHRVKSWRLYRHLTWKRCPTDKKQIVDDLYSRFTKMNVLLQKVSNWFAGCDHPALTSTKHAQMLQDIGCDKEHPPRSQDEKDGFMDCKVLQLEYYDCIVFALFAVFVAIVVAILACVYKTCPHLLDRRIVENEATNKKNAVVRAAMDGFDDAKHRVTSVE